MDPMVRTVHNYVTTHVMVVTTLTVPVIEDVSQAGKMTTVKKVIYLNYIISARNEILGLSWLIF